MATVSFTEQPQGNDDMSRYSEQAPKDVLPPTGESLLAKAQAAFAVLREAERSENAIQQQLTRFLHPEEQMSYEELVKFAQEVQKNSAQNDELTQEQLEEVRRMAALTVAFIQMKNRPEQTPILGEQVPETKGGVFIPPRLKEALRHFTRSAAALLFAIVTMACTVQPAGASAESASAVIEYLEKEIDALPVTPTPTKTPAPTATPRPTAVATATKEAPLPTVTPESPITPEAPITLFTVPAGINVREIPGKIDDVELFRTTKTETLKITEEKIGDDGKLWVHIESIGEGENTVSGWMLKSLGVTSVPEKMVDAGPNTGGGSLTSPETPTPAIINTTPVEIGSTVSIETPAVGSTSSEIVTSDEDVNRLAEFMGSIDFEGPIKIAYSEGVTDEEGDLTFKRALAQLLLIETGLSVDELLQLIEKDETVIITILARSQLTTNKTPSFVVEQEIEINPGAGLEFRMFETQQQMDAYIAETMIDMGQTDIKGGNPQDLRLVSKKSGKIVGAKIIVGSSDLYVLYCVNDEGQLVIGQVGDAGKVAIAQRAWEDLIQLAYSYAYPDTYVSGERTTNLDDATTGANYNADALVIGTTTIDLPDALKREHFFEADKAFKKLLFSLLQVLPTSS